MPNQPTTAADEARDIRGLLHLAGRYATRAVAAAEAMDVAWKAMVAFYAGREDEIHATDWACHVEALAATSRACSELARARQEQVDVEMLERLRQLPIREAIADDYAAFELVARERDQLKVWLPTIAEHAIDLYAQALGDSTHDQARARALTEVAEGISSVAGDPDLGSTIAYVARPPGADPMVFKPTDVDVVTADTRTEDGDR